MRNKVLNFILEVVIAGVASWGAGKVEKKLDELFGTGDDDEESFILNFGLEMIAEKFHEFLIVKDRLDKALLNEKYGRAKHIAFHLKCIRRDIETVLVGMQFAEDVEIDVDFLDAA